MQLKRRHNHQTYRSENIFAFSLQSVFRYKRKNTFFRNLQEQIPHFHSFFLSESGKPRVLTKEDRLLKINKNIVYESAEKEVIKKEKLKDIANFINNFKEPDKTYFYLKYFINMESKEIAKKYNTTLSSVENRLYRCRLALKKIIDGGVQSER